MKRTKRNEDITNITREKLCQMLRTKIKGSTEIIHILTEI